MYYVTYDPHHFESEPVATLKEAEELINEIAIEITAAYGYCDPDELFIREYEGN